MTAPIDPPDPSDPSLATASAEEPPPPIATPVVEGRAPADEPVIDPAAALREERDRLREQLLRTAADFDNFRKRARKDLEDSERRGREDTVRELLPVFDNLERAVSAAATAIEVGPILEGVRMVLRLFEDQAGRVGLSRVKAVGERFDPAIHDAIQQVETDEHAPGTVMAEVVPGYRLGERLVRPSMVVVARKPAASA